MRLASAAYALASLTAVLAVPAAAPAQPGPPMRKAGLWEMTMSMTAPMAMHTTSQVCTDAASEARGAAFANQMNRAPGMSCTPGPITPAAGGWRYSTTCTMKSMTMNTEGTASGDFSGGYHIDSTTTMTMTSGPAMPATRMSIDAKWVGPCSAGMVGGDMTVNGKLIHAPKQP